MCFSRIVAFAVGARERWLDAVQSWGQPDKRDQLLKSYGGFG